MTPKKKKQAIQEALRIHGILVQTKPQGTLDRVMKIEAHQQVMGKAAKAFRAFFGK